MHATDEDERERQGELPGRVPGSFLAALSAEEAAGLVERGIRRRYEPGAVIFREREASDNVVLLLRGRVEVTASEDGEESVVAVRGPGDLLGELSALDGEPRSATVTAREPLEALIVGAEEFKAYLASRASVALLLLRMLSRRLRESAWHETEFVAFDTVGRVAAQLLELASRAEEAAGEPTVAVGPEELATMTGSPATAVREALQALEGPGWIRTEGTGIRVLDSSALKRRSS